jgi:hypothetical protein
MTENFCHECERRKQKKRPDLTSLVQLATALATIVIKSGLIDFSLLFNHWF